MNKNVQQILLLTLIASSMFLAACNNRTNEENTNSEESLTIHESIKQEPTADESNDKDRQDTTDSNIESDAEDIKIRLTIDSEEIIVNMDDNPTSKDFLSLLPLTLTFEDYAGTEKISYPEKKLSTENAPSGIDPKVGDFSYYAPWGNLVIYYKDFAYSNGLIKLGEIESGIEKFESLDSDFTMKIEKTE